MSDSDECYKEKQFIITNTGESPEILMCFINPKNTFFFMFNISEVRMHLTKLSYHWLIGNDFISG